MMGGLLAVVQDDILHEDLTVREILGYSAWLRSTVHMVSEAKGEVVDDVIDLLRLRHVQVHLHPSTVILAGATCLLVLYLANRVSAIRISRSTLLQ